MKNEETKTNEPTSEEIKKAVDELGLKLWNEVVAKSLQLSPNNQRSAWIFRGRVFQSLYANHFVAIAYQTAADLDRDSKVPNEK